MKIGIVLPATPTYSETFFNTKIKGLQENGLKVVLFVQTIQNCFDLCPVIKSPKVYKNSFFQMFVMLFCFLKLIPHFKSVKKFLILEYEQNSSLQVCIKKLYLNSHILSLKLDWLHFGFVTMALGKENAAKSIGAKMAVSLRGYDINVYPLKFPDCYTFVWKKVDKVHSISRDLLSKAYKLGLSKQILYQIITPAVDMNLFKFENSKINSSKIHILTVGRLHWVKGLDYSLKAMYLLKQKNIQFLYTVIGDGEGFEQLSFQINKMGLADCVKLVGKKSPEEVKKQIDNTTIYLQYSVSEGFCNAVLEAQAMGLLCVVADAGALRENILHDRTGWIVPKRNPQKLMETIFEILSLSDSEKNTIRDNAKKRVQANFSIEKQQLEFINFYHLN